MMKLLQALKTTGFIIAIITFGERSLAIDRTFVPATGLWNVPSNWSPAGIPAGTDNVIIPSNKFCSVNVILSRTANLDVQANGSIKFLQNFNQFASGTITVVPTGVADVSSVSATFTNGCNVTGILTVNSATHFIFETCPLGTLIPTINPKVIGNISVATTSKVSLSDDIKILNNTAVGSGCELILDAHKLSVNTKTGSGNLIYTTGPTGSSVEFIGTNDLIINGLNIRSLYLNNTGNATFSGPLVLAGDLVIGNNCTASGSGTPNIQAFAGSSIDFVNNNIFSLTQAASVFNLGTGGSFTNNKTVNQTGTLICNGDFVNNGTFNFSGSHSVTINGSFTVTNGSQFNPSGINPTLSLTIPATGTWTNNGLFKSGTSSVLTVSSNSPSGFLNNPVGTLELLAPVNFSNGNTGITNNGNLNSSAEFNFTGTGSPDLNLSKGLIINKITVNKTSGTVSLTGGAKLTVLDAINVTSGTLDLAGKPVILRSTSTQTAQIGQISGVLNGTGNVTIERYVSGNQPAWYFIGTSIQNQHFNDWTDDFSISGPFPGASLATGPDRTSLFSYDGASPPTGAFYGEVNGWRIPVTSNIENGKGYRAFLNTKFFMTGKIIDNTGDIIQGPFSFNPAFNAAGYGGGGWNFLANPYPSQINWNAAGWTKTNIGGAIYIWNAQTGQYGAYNLANDPPGSNPGTNGVTNIIASGQAFFIRATGPSPVLNATETVKSNLSSSFIRQAVEESSFFKMTLSNSNGYTDDNIVRFHDPASLDFDPEYDAYKMNGGTLNLSTITPQGTRLCINSVPRVGDEGMTLKLGAFAYVNGPLNLSFTQFGQDAKELIMWLKDNYLGTITPVKEGTTYPFSTNSDPASKADGRFELTLLASKPFQSKMKESESSIFTYSDPGSNGKLVVRILNPKPLSGLLRIIDFQGRLVFDQEVDPTETTEIVIPFLLSKGLYQTEFIQEKSRLSTKSVVHD